ncbi:nucleoside triphosphate pyrophosphatase [Hydrogenovibrio sp. JE_KL2]|uniref:Maf family protein n=1 Tax=Hydrogenovibrio sp. JE_KL2 TaxID=2651188 RepID=UPI00128BA8BE|nr:Maf family protein [Hydrogenovibrio sp. JE_KL2]MPQ76937.1 septum formation inhibitor Maf [Hydrogenovibrio sp. JE_KL2]
MSLGVSQQNKLFLSSSSPRRLELVKQLNLHCEVVNAPVEEVGLPGESAESYALRMAFEKADSGYNKLAGNDIWVIGGDTLILFEGKVFEKPRNQQDAYRMLKQLSGHSHEVLSSVAVMHDGATFSALNKTRVFFRTLSDAEIEAYWRTGEPCDKAGAYAIQGIAAGFIEKIEGSFSGVMGLPLFELQELLKESGFYQPVNDM